MTDPIARQLRDLIDAGLTIGECIAAFAEQQGPAQQALTAAARDHDLIEDGVLEVDAGTISAYDDDAIGEEGGGYVLAWLWVDDPTRIDSILNNT